MSNTIKGTSVATFKCKASGNAVSFLSEGDIAGMRTHEGYSEVLDEASTAKVEEAKAAKEEVLDVVMSQKEFKKKLGRPAKNS